MRPQSRTQRVQKLLNDTPPLQESDAAVQNRVLLAMTSELKAVPGISAEFHKHYNGHNVISVKAYGEFMDIVFRQNILTVENHNSGFHSGITNAQQVIRMYELFKEIDQQKKLEELKTQKIQTLKLRSVEAKVMQLADEFQFYYSIRSMHNKIKLSITRDRVEGLIVDIPFGRFQDTLAGLHTLIKTVFELRDQGIRFHVGPVLKVRQWSPPKQSLNITQTSL